MLRSFTHVALGLRLHLGAVLGPVPLVEVEALDGLHRVLKAHAVVGPQRFGDVIEVVGMEEEVTAQDVPGHHVHHLGLSIRRGRAGRRHGGKIHDDDPRRPEVELAGLA